MTTLTNLAITLVTSTNDYEIDITTEEMLAHVEFEKLSAEGSTLLNTVDVFDMDASQLKVLMEYMMGYATWTYDMGLLYNIADSRLQGLELAYNTYDDEDGPDSFDADSYGAYSIK